MARDIDQWLERVGLGKYAPLFAENEIDFDVLNDLNEQDLKDIGIPLGARKKLMKAIAAIDARGPAGEPDPAFTARGEAERRQLTVMFCDLVGSTALSTRFDPEDLREILRAYHDVCAAVIAQYGGYVAKYLGDGVLVYFGYPRAHENDTDRAIRAGLGIVAAVAGIGDPLNGGARDLELSVRVGINTGLVVVGDIIGEGAAEQASVVGETPNLAARLQEFAGPNQIVLGPLTRELIGDRFSCEDLGVHRLHGIAEPVAAWRVVRERGVDDAAAPDAASNLTLVGRQEELGLLMRSWDASKRGIGQVVLVQGEAGIGKSRLIDAMRARLDGDYVCVTTRCSPYRVNATLYPVIEHLKRVMDWRPEDDEASRLVKLESALALQSLPLERATPLFAELLSLPLPPGRYAPLQLTAQEQREMTLDALASWLLEEAERRPVLHFWEDLHWADPTTLELLRLCIDQSPTVAMMTVLTYRADFVAPWTMRSHVTLITLNRLDRGEVEGLMLQRTGGKGMPAEVVEYVVRKTDGVPLYVEELTKTIVEAGFVRDSGNCYELTRPLSGITIPATLQDLLMARLDRLPSIREVAQLGSILGREFAYEMLQAIASIDEAALEQGLDQLVHAELLYQRGRRPRARYMFKHALVQDAAYQSLLKRTRQFYHRQVGRLLENRYPDIAKTQPELLAHHYSNAGEDEKALQYLIVVADKSAAMSAHAEAVATLDDACRHAERMPAAERDRVMLMLLVRQAHSLHFLGRRQQIVDLLSRHQGGLERTSDFSLAAEFFFWLGFAHAWLGHREPAVTYLQRSLAQAQQAGNRAIAGRVHRALATEFVYSGKPLADAIAHAREAASLLERTEDRFWFSQALFTLSYCCIFAGDFVSALEAAARLGEFGDATGIRRAQANASMLAGLAHAMRGEGETGIELCRRALAISPDDFETAFILACLGRAHLAMGQHGLAVAALEKAVPLADGIRSVQFCAWFRTMLGEAYLASGAFDKAAGVAQEALEAGTHVQFAVGVGLSRQILGRVARAKGAPAEAEQHLKEAANCLAATGANFDLALVQSELAAIANARPHCPP